MPGASQGASTLISKKIFNHFSYFSFREADKLSGKDALSSCKMYNMNSFNSTNNETEIIGKRLK